MLRSAENPIVLRVAEPGSTGALVVTHPGALRVETYDVLAAALPEGIGMYVFAIDRVPEYHHSVLSGRPLEITLADIAEKFAKELGTHVGDLPYVMLGWSFGGVVAYAVAESAAREPEHLLLLDSIAPGAGDPGKELGSVLPDREALDWFALYLGAKRDCPLGFTPADFAATTLEEGLRLILEEAISRGALFGDTSIDGLRKAFETYRGGVLRNKQLHDGYTPEKPQWPVSLVRPQRGLFNDVRELGWDVLTGDRLTVHECAGDHYTMLTDPDSVGLISALVERTFTHG